MLSELYEIQHPYCDQVDLVLTVVVGQDEALWLSVQAQDGYWEATRLVSTSTQCHNTLYRKLALCRQ